MKPNDPPVIGERAPCAPDTNSGGAPHAARASVASHWRWALAGNVMGTCCQPAGRDPNHGASARQKRVVTCAGEYEIDRVNWRRPAFYGPLV